MQITLINIGTGECSICRKKEKYRLVEVEYKPEFELLRSLFLCESCVKSIRRVAATPGAMMTFLVEVP